MISRVRHTIRRSWTCIVLVAALSTGAGIAIGGPLLLNELKVNPPGGDAPFEYIELRGDPGFVCSNLFVLVIEGDDGDDPGTLDLQIELSGLQLGSNGYLVLVGDGHPYHIPSDTTVITNAALGDSGGSLDNGAVSFLLATSPVPLEVGTDLDDGDNGTLEDAPAEFVILDAVGWEAGDKDDVVYGGAKLEQPGSIPDAATRFPGNDTARDDAAWFNADLADGSAAQLLYGLPAGDNFPIGSILTPGAPNYIAPQVDSLTALSGVIGDPTNPGLTLSVDPLTAAPGPFVVTAASDNPGVVPDSNLVVSTVNSNTFSLSLAPIGVGYAEITIFVANSQSTGVWHLAYAASRPDRPGGTFLTGVSDGSAAVPVDADWMLVADDEDEVIRLYPRNVSGAPVASFDLEPFLALTDYEDGDAREVDFEAVTRSGDSIYWLGSHSHAEIGELRPNRWRVVATQLSGTGTNATLTYLGHYEHLRDDLLAWDQGNGHGRGANHYGLVASAADGVIPKEPSGAGFNIEGLTMVPGTTNSAYICFRAPLATVTNRALSVIVPVTNFTSMATAGSVPGQAAFGDPFELFLGGRSVRGIEGGPDGFLLTAGPVDNRFASAPHIYKLYSWSGLPGDPPQERSADLTFLNAECIVELPPAPWTATSRVQVISDTGRTRYYGDGIKAKLLPEPAFKKFRSDWIELGVVVEARPELRSFRMLPAGWEVSWFAQTGRTYRLQRSVSLAPTSWTNHGPGILADLPLMFQSFAPPGASAASLRLLLLPQ